MELSCAVISRYHPALPTACFLHLVVIPLATWIFILLTPFSCLAYLRFKRKHKSSKSDANKSSIKPRLLVRIASGIYYFLALALLALQSLQLARLAIAGFSIGLLPFTYAGVLLAALLHFLSRATVVRSINALYWLMLAVVFAVTVATLVKDEGGRERRGRAAKYPLGDEVTDAATIAGVAVVLGALEFAAR